MPNNSSLFKEFKAVSAKEWKQQIQVDLKGADYNNTLIWESLEGIHIKPFYHNESLEYLDIPTPKDDFKICQTIFIDDVEVANKIALDALKKGADALQFIAHKSFDIDVLFQGFKDLNTHPIIYFKPSFLSPRFNSQLLGYFDDYSVIIQQDIINQFAKEGKWFTCEEDDFKAIKQLKDSHKNHLIISVDASLYQNAGANTVQQVAYALAHANEYLNAFGKETAKSIQFEFSVGSNYFFEIAKLRAFRYLWKKLTQKHGEKSNAKIIAKPSLRNKTLYDYNVNMLRSTTENMSAVLGGADTLSTVAYDSFFKKSNAFSQRIARNQLLLLKEENNFKNAQYFAKGSYYIEALSIEIANKALSTFQNIEKLGGFISQLKRGGIQTKIKEAADKEQALFDSGKLVLLGTNKYPNTDDLMKENMQLYPFVKKEKKQTLIAPIIAKRLAEKTEQERLLSE